jgi:hypothetical protein
VDPAAIDQTVATEFVDHVQQKLVMETDELLGPMIGQPSKSDTITVSDRPEMLMRTLHGSYHPAIRGDQTGLPHHIPFMGAVAVDSYQERGRLNNPLRDINVIIKIDLSFETQIGLHVLISHNMLKTSL